MSKDDPRTAILSPFFSLKVGPESTDFGFFGLVGFVKEKYKFCEIFRSPGKFWLDIVQ